MTDAQKKIYLKHGFYPLALGDSKASSAANNWIVTSDDGLDDAEDVAHELAGGRYTKYPELNDKVTYTKVIWKELTNQNFANIDGAIKNLIPLNLIDPTVDDSAGDSLIILNYHQIIEALVFLLTQVIHDISWKASTAPIGVDIDEFLDSEFGKAVKTAGLFEDDRDPIEKAGDGSNQPSKPGHHIPRVSKGPMAGKIRGLLNQFTPNGKVIKIYPQGKVYRVIDVDAPIQATNPAKKVGAVVIPELDPKYNYKGQGSAPDVNAVLIMRQNNYHQQFCTFDSLNDATAFKAKLQPLFPRCNFQIQSANPNRGGYLHVKTDLGNVLIQANSYNEDFTTQDDDEILNETAEELLVNEDPKDIQANLDEQLEVLYDIMRS